MDAAQHDRFLKVGKLLLDAVLVFFLVDVGGFAAGLLLQRPLLLWRYRSA